jgi:TolA-binding protein
MSFELITAVTIAGTISSIIAGLFEILVLKKFRRPETLEIRIKKLMSALKESSKLVTEVESEISARQELVVELQKDAQRYQQLIQLNKEQVEAVAQVLQGELRKEGNKSFWRGVCVNFVFFALGALLSWYLTK